MAPEKASVILNQFSRKRRAAALVVPTADADVRQRLRQLGHPITLFGEDAVDRRDRLRELMLEAEEQAEVEGRGGVSLAPDVEMEEEAGEGEDNEEFYTEGTPDLLEARRRIARYSLPRARARIDAQREQASIPLRSHIRYRKAIKEKLMHFELFGSQIAGERPVSIARFSPSAGLIAAGNWGGGMRLLSVPSLDEVAMLRGHTDRVGGLSWYPGATLPQSGVSDAAVNLASGGGEGKVHLWSLTQDTPLAMLSGHSGRVCRVEFHPMGEHLASASYDTTWRLWDVQTQQELLLQEGHSREVYSLAFSPDGALMASGGLDSIGRIWDLRTGRTVMILEGHIREIYAVDWSVDGYRVLTGSGDGWVKCWDIRQVRNTGGVGAHKSVVSDLRWFKGHEGPASYLHAASEQESGGGGRRPHPPPRASGTFFVSSGFDKNVNIFSADDWSLIKPLSAHAGNVLSADVSADARWIASSGHDRTVKLWGVE